tara:strand:+ start:311 stop:709 length:399 start_codon:yes stop_codon:yes gene_type:complete
MIVMKKENIKISSNRSFGIVFFIFFLIVSLYPLSNDKNINIVALTISIFFLVLGLLNSKILFPLNKIWFKFGIILGNLISPLIMSVIFFVIITPIGLLMRMFGKDVLNLKYNDNKSYWIDKDGPKSKMKNQF